MYSRLLVLFSICLEGIMLFSCHSDSSRAHPIHHNKLSSDTNLTIIENDTSENPYNDYARFFAGLKPLKHSGLIALTHDSIWIRHSSKMDSGFAGIEKRRFEGLRKWRDIELKEANSSGVKTLFYPFSGPDFLNAWILFPGYSNYILTALEPSGRIKDVTKMKRKDLNTYLNSISGSLVDIFHRSYFITKRMSGDFSRWKMEGNLATLMVFLARTGNSIVQMNRVAIDTNGNSVFFRIYDSVPRKYISRGVRITFRSEGDSSLKYVYYFSTNLGDMEFDRMQGLNTNKGFIRFVENKAPYNSFCKAASYLLHYGTFNLARNLILKHSRFHLQDDSGIGYKYFDKNKWSFTYYGKYSRPIQEFSKIYEYELEKDMKKDSAHVRPLPFRYGYHWGKGTPSMLLAKKKT